MTEDRISKFNRPKHCGTAILRAVRACKAQWHSLTFPQS